MRHAHHRWALAYLMALSAPLSLGGLQLVSPQGQNPAVYDVGQPVVLPQVGPAAFGTGVGFFEGPVSGNPESVTGQQNPAGTPSQGATPGSPTGPAVAGVPNGIGGMPGISGPATGATPAGIAAAANPIGIMLDAIGAFPGVVTTGAQAATNANNPAGAAIGALGPLSQLFDVITGLLGGKGPSGGPTPAPPGLPEDVVTGLGNEVTGPGPNDPTGPNDPGPGPNDSTNPADPGMADPTPAPTPDPAAVAAAAASGAASAATPSVICTELRRQGLMDDLTWERDEAFGRLVPPDVRAGYLVWAPTVVGWMQASPLMTRLVALVALPWAREMAYGDSVIGRIVMRGGWVVCRSLGRRALIVA